jgi:hypothetical protein
MEVPIMLATRHLSKRRTGMPSAVSTSPTWNVSVPAPVSDLWFSLRESAGFLGFLLIYSWLSAMVVPWSGPLNSVLGGLVFALFLSALIYQGVFQVFLFLWFNVLRRFFDRPFEFTSTGTNSHKPLPEAVVLSVLEDFFGTSAGSSSRAPLILRQKCWQLRESRMTPVGLQVTAQLDLMENANAGCSFALRLYRPAHLTVIATRTDERTIQFAWQMSTYNRSANELLKIIDYTHRELHELLNRTTPSMIKAQSASSYNRLLKNIETESLAQAERSASTTGRWPTPQEFNEALQSPRTSFLDEELKTGLVHLDNLGLPRPESGAFATVYRVNCQDADIAVKCFLGEYDAQARRYDEISKFLSMHPLSSCVRFRYSVEGIRISNRRFPILQMDWVDGIPFLSFIEQNLHRPETLRDLSCEFRELTAQLSNAGIAHGDLQHGNIIVVGNSLKLVDYDGMYVPALAGLLSNELGHRNYQHPARTKEHFGPYLDNFSAHVIDASLNILSLDRSLWDEFVGGDECILFRHSDFCSPSSSRLFRRLRSHGSPSIRTLASDLQRLLELSPKDVPPL